MRRSIFSFDRVSTLVAMPITFYDEIIKFNSFDFEGFFNQAKAGDIERILHQELISELDFLLLLSGEAFKYIEALAQKAQRITLRNFGRAVCLYAP
ncbi:MAG: hypothetical protein Q8K15_00445, partial [Candidatus Omnitrophota bacterium]|nr:hypothetical protein [Candidatus Omnitrophota bacterium]